MTLRPAADPAAAPPEQAIDLRAAAELLGMSECWVRRAVNRGDLQGFRAGRAVRVFLWSLQAYQRRNAITPAPRTTPAATARPTVAHQEAMAQLRRLGVIRG